MLVLFHLKLITNLLHAGTDSVNVYYLITVSFEQLAFPYFQQFKNLNKKQFNLKIHIKKFKKYVMCISYLILSAIINMLMKIFITEQSCKTIN